MERVKINNVIVSVSNKNGIEDFIKPIFKSGARIISTGGTAQKLSEAGIEVKLVEELTGFAEMLGGRVKTLHPKVHGGILAKKDNKQHLSELEHAKIKPVDMVVCNLYPFRKTVEKKDVSLEDAIENIDIGGITLLRAAAKNYENVAVVSSVSQYNSVLKELKENDFEISVETREKLAQATFEHTALYDAAISEYLRKQFSPLEFPKEMSIGLELLQECRYGENPHQMGALYRNVFGCKCSAINGKQLQGKEMSFNNWNDLNAGVELCKEFSKVACVIVKHANPCGCATGKNISEAFTRAYECDSKSAFGGIIVLNMKCDNDTAAKITGFFNEIVAAPDFSEGAIQQFSKKKNLRVIKLESLGQKCACKEYDFKKLSGGVLVQEKDSADIGAEELNFVTERRPYDDELDDLLFAWKVAKHVKSNAIVLARNQQAFGVGAGQMSRVDSLEFAIKRAGGKTKGAVMASDAFFPFRDSIDTAAGAGITAIIQPGGSIKDDEVIKAANEKGIAMVFTGVRHFRH